jgi:DNA replication protein DnaC
LYVDFPDLLREIQNSYNPMTQGSEYLILAPILDAEVLILDDLGSQKWSPWVQDILAHVINDRYKHGHCTIFTTNYLDPESSSKSNKELDQNQSQKLKQLGVIGDDGLVDQFKIKTLKDLGLSLRANNDLDTLEERIGDRLRSRLSQMCKTVSMHGEDFRKLMKTNKVR